ncbi:unnamed protein product, partial [Prorocentrum cordatum]
RRRRRCSLLPRGPTCSCRHTAPGPPEPERPAAGAMDLAPVAVAVAAAAPEALGPAAAGAGWKPRGAAEWPPALAAFVARASEDRQRAARGWADPPQTSGRKASAASARGSAARLEALEAEVARLREGFSVALMELAELRASSGEPRHDHDSPRISAHAAREAAAEAASCRGAAEAAAAAASEAASAAAAAASEAEA